MQVVLATRSSGKLAELEPMLRSRGFEPSTLAMLGVPELPEEDALECFDTFEENARAKAEYFAARCAPRLVIADDSGLEVDALGGAPGVRSKRWSGRADLGGQALDDANNALLLRALEEAGALREEQRGARYVCVMASAIAGNPGSGSMQFHWRFIGRGTCEGRILQSPIGGGGFGYDPVFWSSDLGVGFGEVAREVKATVSHRRRALDVLLSQLPRELLPELSRTG